jgi:hypothetical protein
MLTFVAFTAFVAATCVTLPSVSLLLLTFGVGCIILSLVLDTTC